LSGPQVNPLTVTNPILNAFGQGRNSPVDDVLDNFQKTWRNHSFKFGGRYSHTEQQGYNFANIYPTISLATGSGNTPAVPAFTGGLLTSTASSQTTAYQNLYNNLLGRMNQVSQTFYSADLSTWQPAGSARVRNHILTEHGYYFQDDWKVMRNLTVNMGLRWELFLPPHEVNGIQATVDQAAQIGPNYTSTNLTIQRSTDWYKTDWNNFAPRVGFAWDVKGDGKTALRGNYGIFYDRTSGATVSFSDGNTPGFSQGSIVQPNAQTTSAQLAAIGCGNGVVGDVRIGDCIPLPAQPAAPVLTLPVANKPTSIVLFNPNLRTGYVHQYSLDLQRELFRNTILDVAYIGSRGVKLFANRDWNQARTAGAFLQAFNELKALDASGTPVSANNVLVKIYGTAAAATAAVTTTNLRNNSVGLATDNVDATSGGGFTKYAAAGLPATFIRNYPQFYEVIAGTNDGRSYYDALTVSVRRYAGAVRVNANYTYSHTIDNIGGNGINQQPSSATDGNGYAIPIDNFDLTSNRGTGDSDHRHSFNASLIYAFPFGAGKRWGSGWNRLVDGFAGGWELGSLFVAQDGNVYTISSGRTTCSNLLNCRSDYTGSHAGSAVYNADGSVFFYTATQLAGFTTPAPGSVGNSGRNGFRGPGYFNIDASLVKHFKITERHVISFRAEAYNVLNKANFQNPSVGVLTPATFGQISGTRGATSSTSSARTMQLTLRYDF